MRVSELELSPAVRKAFDHLLSAMDGQWLPEPCGWNVLVLQYVKPDVTASGIHLPNVVQKEDEYQGRTGLVLSVGPGAWADRTRFPEGAWAYPGDTVIWGRSEGSRLSFGEYSSGKKVVLTLLADDRILAKGIDPMVSGQ